MGTHDHCVSLSDIKTGENAVVVKLLGSKLHKQRLMALGMIMGQAVSLDIQAPMGDPKVYSILGYRLSIRNDDAAQILVARVS